jgi:hypothetical protein
VSRSYATAVTLSLLTATVWVLVAPRVAKGFSFLRGQAWMSAGFVLCCLIWSVFGLQDSVLTGVRRGGTVLAENTAWGLARLALVGTMAAAVTARLGFAYLVAAWAAPAGVLVMIISWILFFSPRGAIPRDRSDAKGIARVHRFVAIEWVSSALNSENLVLPAVALSALGARGAAPFLTAYSFVVVIEVALGALLGALTVELVHDSKSASLHLAVRMGGPFIALVVAGTILGASRILSLYGASYAADGAPIMKVLVLGLLGRSCLLLANAVNRGRNQPMRNLALQALYAVILMVGLWIVPLSSGVVLAWLLVGVRTAVGVVALIGLEPKSSGSQVEVKDAVP